MTEDLRKQLLDAKADGEAQETVMSIFNLVHSDPVLEDIDALLAWAKEPSVLPKLHPLVFIACLRITYMIQDSLPNWTPLLDAVDGEMRRRLEDADSILIGLKEA